ncbi:MAG: metallophosphoesterase [Armatimonadota bacterium]
MRYAVLSDIHSNLVALEAVLDDLAGEAIDRYVCLGDIIGYGARPNQCCDVIRELGAVTVRGNHDEAAVDTTKAEWFTAPARACILWTAQQLRADNLQFLRELPPLCVIDDRFTICHGSIPDPDHYTVTPLDALLSLSVMETPVGFFGHTHYAEWFASADRAHLPSEHPLPAGGIVRTDNGRLYLINPGAVGQPRDGNERASYAVYDVETGQVSVRRVEYDIAKTVQQMQAAGLPEAMYARLWLGV